MTQHTKENFARYLGSGQIIRRRDLSVHVAHTRLRRGSGEQAARDETRQAADPAALAEAKRRFEICKACEHSRDDCFTCALYHGCCFGKFRSNPDSRCPVDKWSRPTTASQAIDS